MKITHIQFARPGDLVLASYWYAYRHGCVSPDEPSLYHGQDGVFTLISRENVTKQKIRSLTSSLGTTPGREAWVIRTFDCDLFVWGNNIKKIWR